MMAASYAAHPIYLCHFCSDEFFTRSTLLAHLSHCQFETSRKSHDDKAKCPILNQTQKNILHMVQLHHLTHRFSSTTQQHSLPCNDIDQYLQIPLSNLSSRGYSCSKQSSFDDAFCSTDISLPIRDNYNDDPLHSTLLNPTNNKLMSCHVYKYSRRERDRFYARIRRAIMKKHILLGKTSRAKESPSFIFNQTHFLIQIPTKIHSRQRISSSTTNTIYPLLFDPHFPELVKLPSPETIFARYQTEMNIFFHLIHSIASQEFQLSIINYDHQHQLSYTSYSLIHLLRQTMFDSNTNLKRNYFQSFQRHHHEQELTPNAEQDSFIPPLKIRRYDQSSYEIKNRSTSSTGSSSASSGISITQINHEQRRRRSETRPNKLSDQQINSNCSSNHAHVPIMHFHDHDTKDLPDFSVESPAQNDLVLLDNHQCSQSNDRNSNESLFSSSFTHTDASTKRRASTSPNVIREQANDALPKYQSVALNDGARIRIVNCSHDNSKYASARNQNSSSTNKRLSHPIDENWTTKPARINTRKISSTNSKTSDISEVSSYQTQSVRLTDGDITHGWLTHSVFYRCHACSREEFFVVLSRECMSLHISSEHGNQEENFKQRISNFLNNQGRALKIFQHYLKWQQPWSEKEIDQLFQLSHIHPRINGAS